MLRSTIWSSIPVNVMHLTDNMRVQNCIGDPARLEKFAEWLLKVGEGKVPAHKPEEAPYRIGLPAEMCGHISDVAELTLQALMPTIKFVFPDLIRRADNESEYTNRGDDDWFGTWIGKRAILAPHNKSVDTINTIILDMMPGEKGASLTPTGHGKTRDSRET